MSGDRHADAVDQFKKNANMALFGGMFQQFWNAAPECPGCGKSKGMDTDCLTCVFHPSWQSSLFIPEDHPNYP